METRFDILPVGAIRVGPGQIKSVDLGFSEGTKILANSNYFT